MDLFMVCFCVEFEIGSGVYIHRISWKTTQFNQLICARNDDEKKNIVTRKKKVFATFNWVPNNNGCVQTIARICTAHIQTMANISHIKLNACHAHSSIKSATIPFPIVWQLSHVQRTSMYRQNIVTEMKMTAIRMPFRMEANLNHHAMWIVWPLLASLKLYNFAFAVENVGLLKVLPMVFVCACVCVSVSASSPMLNTEQYIKSKF